MKESLDFSRRFGMTERKMKDSGIEWIGEVPEDWDITKNKYIFNQKRTIVGPRWDELQLLSLTTKGVIEKDIDNLEGKLPESFDTYQEVKKGDQILCLFDLDISAVFNGLSEYDGMISSAYRIYNLKDTEENNSRYFNYLFDYAFVDRKYKNYSKSLRFTIDSENFKSIETIKPPIREQEKIADFLEVKTAQIDEIISDIKSQIEILREYKMSVITEAVTKGLNKDVEMKDSGIEWIGEVPKHWKISKLKYLGDAWNGLTYSPADISSSEEGTLVLRSSNVQKGKLSAKDNVYVKGKIPTKLYVKDGDILICSRNGSRDLIGKNALIYDVKATFGAFMMIYRCIDPRMMYYVLNSKVFSYYLGTFLTATINQLTINNFNNIEIPWSSLSSERKEISDFLDKKTVEIDSIISDKEEQVGILEDYKKSVIYEYVTGKKEVQNG